MKYIQAIVLMFFPQIIFGQISSYKYYNEDSTVNCEIIQLDSIMDAHRHILYFHRNGKKASEYFDKNRVPYDTLFKWDNQGNLTRLEIYSDSGYIEIDYYDNGNLSQIGQWKRMTEQKYDIVIYDSTNWDIYEATECKYPCFQRSGIWKTFYKNGVLRSEGKYLPIKFSISYPTLKDSNGVSQIIPKTSFSVIPELIYIGCYTYLFDGNWIYYTEEGKIEKIMEYQNGLPKKQ